MLPQTADPLRRVARIGEDLRGHTGGASPLERPRVWPIAQHASESRRSSNACRLLPPPDAQTATRYAIAEKGKGTSGA
jgi:hypothetical protein